MWHWKVGSVLILLTAHVFNSQADIILQVSDFKHETKDEPLKGSKEKGNVSMIVLCCFMPLSKAH